LHYDSIELSIAGRARSLAFVRFEKSQNATFKQEEQELTGAVTTPIRYRLEYMISVAAARLRN